MTKTKHFTFCNDELIDDPLTQSYINDPRAKHILDCIHDYNHFGIRSNGRCGRDLSSHMRITPNSLKLAEKIKNDTGMEVFPAQRGNSTANISGEGGSTWEMYIIAWEGHSCVGTLGSEYTVRDLITCKGKFEIEFLSGGDYQVIPSIKDQERLDKLHIGRMNRISDRNIKIINERADINLARMSDEEYKFATGRERKKNY
jgi:hypothetical protein